MVSFMGVVVPHNLKQVLSWLSDAHLEVESIEVEKGRIHGAK